MRVCMILLCWMAMYLPVSEGIYMSAFNIQTLGVSKMGKPEVVEYLVKIIDRYDLVVIQELRDASGESIVDLLNAVNAYSSAHYDMVLGSRAGRSSYKEQYVYMYRPSELKITGFYEYPEPADEFEREPMMVRFQATNGFTAQKDFVVMAIHAKPDDAAIEIDYLTDVYDNVYDTWGVKDVAIVGDFNADCSYVGDKDWANIRLRTQSRFKWLIDDAADTTVNTNTNCAYDRLVVTGNLFTTAIRAAVFDYHSYYNLDYDLAYDISDHYPVEMTIS